MPTSAPTEIRLGDILKQLRSRKDLSQRDLAELTGLPLATVASIETGREPRHSTLAVLLEKLPFLTAGDVLGDAGRPATARPAAWAAYRELLGFQARHLLRRVDLRPDGSGESLHRLTGVRPWPGKTIDDAEHLVALLRCVLVGSRQAVAEIVPEALERPGRLVVEDGALTHVFDVPAPGSTDGIDYERRSRVEADEQLASALEGDALRRVAVEILFPVEKLDLEVLLPERPTEPRCVAWSCLADGDAANADCARHLHPRGVALRWERAEEKLVLGLSRPTVGAVQGVAWRAPEAPDTEDEERPGRLVGARRKRSLAQVVTEAREDAGLSQRQLAQRMGVSPNTVNAIEKGGDARLSVLTGLLEALPELTPQELLPQVASGGQLDLDELWEHDHRLTGAAADEVAKTVDIDEEGRCEITIVTKGLRSLLGDERELSVRSGIWRMVLQGQSHVLAEIETDVEARARVVERKLGRIVHRFTFPARAASQGLSYTRRFERAPLYALTEERASSLTEEDPPYFEGTALAPTHPTRRLSICVRFPTGYWPVELETHAWSLLHVFGHGDHAAKVELPKGRVKLERSPSRSMLRMRVERPLLGLQFSLAWRLPPR
ncbi:MAG: helix-turn-helix domain-containing protein [Acidobacteriota bacterium]